MGLLVAGMLACSSDNVRYAVTGSHAPEDGASVYLIDQTTRRAIDSTVVTRGAFELKGMAEKDAFLAIAVGGSDRQFLLFNDGKPVQVDVAAGMLTGSAPSSGIMLPMLSMSRLSEGWMKWRRSRKRKLPRRRRKS